MQSIEIRNPATLIERLVPHGDYEFTTTTTTPKLTTTGTLKNIEYLMSQDYQQTLNLYAELLLYYQAQIMHNEGILTGG